MPVYMVSYDIPEGNPSYEKTVEYLEKELEAKRVLKSQWLINHDGNSEAILKELKLKGGMQKDDRLLVHRVVASDFAWENPILPADDLTLLLAAGEDEN